ncbi:MAG: transglutaminase domain-containing protein, partial [Bacteroidales bacterium]
MQTVSNPIGIRNTLYMNGNTSDIVNSILYADAKDKSDVSVLAAKLKGNTDLESCQNIWNYIKKNIVYRTDPPGNQFIKSPSKLYFDKIGDCKSFSIFYASLLKALNIQYKYRFASYSNDSKEFTHVYVIAKNSIICDAVMSSFNKEQNYKFKKDFEMTKISYMSGIG